jgi:hypothetical protein
MNERVVTSRRRQQCRAVSNVAAHLGEFRTGRRALKARHGVAALG